MSLAAPASFSRVALLALAASSAPGCLDAQQSLRGRFPPASVPEAVLATVPQEVDRLPVYDDAGVVIPYAEISERVSNRSGAAWVLGMVLGALGGAVGVGLTRYDCVEDDVYASNRCSPRESAMRVAVPVGLSTVGIVLGIVAGVEYERVTWREALEQIRRERREAGLP
ncbi:MAG: hypothetical protein R3E98_00335 [Gemmatimonadota bacterium]|nr:hypothetical protein [Gemmatimonadota bacterium]